MIMNANPYAYQQGSVQQFPPPYGQFPVNSFLAYPSATYGPQQVSNSLAPNTGQNNTSTSQDQTCVFMLKSDYTPKNMHILLAAGRTVEVIKTEQKGGRTWARCRISDGKKCWIDSALLQQVSNSQSQPSSTPPDTQDEQDDMQDPAGTRPHIGMGWAMQ